VNTQPYRSRLVPGAFAEHLTSFAATFDTPGQTKLTEWIDAGAAGSVGTVTEPYSLWTKFPMAVVFERYLAGNTLLEALSQSIASPYQSLIVGDPLCRPWGKELKDLGLETKWKGSTLVVRATDAPAGGGTDLHLHLNGHRVPGDGPEWSIETSSEETGPQVNLLLHARYLWAPPEIGVAYRRLDTPHPTPLTLKRLRIRDDKIQLSLKSEVPLVHAELLVNGRPLASTAVDGATQTLALPLSQTGRGPLTLRVRAVSKAGKVLWSEFQSFHAD